MNQALLLWPLVAQVLLVVLLFLRLGMVKDRARAAGAVDLAATALDNDAWPDDVRKVANNIRNQFQVPVLFFVLVLALFAHGSADGLALALAWLFVASRVVHSYIHIGANHVPNRTRVFKLGVIFVVGLAALLVRALIVSACDPPTRPVAPTFEASSPKPHGEPAAEALGTREDDLGLPLGAAIPSFEIEDSQGEAFSSKAIHDATTLVVFYRGGWCPYCNFQIRELSQSYDEFKSLGVSLVAISVDRPDAAAVTRDAYEVPFPVLSDPDLKAHEAFHVVLQLGVTDVAGLAAYGHDIEKWSGKDHHKMAVPAVFLVRDGKVAWAHVARDYKTRPSTKQLLTAVKQ